MGGQGGHAVGTWDDEPESRAMGEHPPLPPHSELGRVLARLDQPPADVWALRLGPDPETGE